MDTRAIIGARPTGQRPQQILTGYVSTEKPAPSSLGDTLWVVIPSHSGSLSIPFDGTRWPKSQGSSLPSQGAPVIVGYDENRRPNVLAWYGTASFPSGSAPTIQMAFPSGDTTGATDAAAISTAESALGGHPGALQFQQGHYFDNGQRNHDGSVAIAYRGITGNTPGAAAGTTLTYTGSAAPYISARSSYGFTIQDMQVLYNNPALTGFFIDLSHSTTSDAAMAVFERCAFGGAGIRTATLFNLDKAIIVTFDSVDFSNGTYAVQGAASSVSYSNAIKFIGGCTFNGFVNPPILNPVQGWVFEGPTFENLFSGAAGAIASALGTTSGMSIDGGWCGDASAGSGIWFDLALSGSKIEGMYAGGGHQFLNLHNSSSGVVVKGNAIEVMDIGVGVGTGCTNLDLTPNFYSAVTSQVSYAALPGGASIFTDNTGSRLQTSQLWGRDGLTTLAADTTGISTSAGIDALFTQAPLDGTMLIDPVNKLVFARAGGKWGKTAALTMLP